MGINLRGRSLDTLLNFTTQEVDYLLSLAKELKNEKMAGILNRPLVGKNIVIIFEKDSTRTRSAFEVAGFDLGAGVTYVGSQGSHMGKVESIEDTAKVFGRMYDGIEFRGFQQSTVDQFVKYSGVSVWNGLTDQRHPTQTLADYLTLREKFGNLKGKKVVFFGDYKNNMGHAVLIGAAFHGMEVVFCGPSAYKNQVQKDVLEKTAELFKINGGSLTFSDDKKTAAKGAHAIYTDVWLSMGESEALIGQRIKELSPFQVDEEVMKLADKDAIFMHALPSMHNDQNEFSKDVMQKYGKEFPMVSKGAMEVNDAVFYSKQSVVFDQAENRMHTIKAAIKAMIGD